MRTGRLILTIVGVGVLTLGIGSASQPSDQAREPTTSQRQGQPSSNPPPDEARGARPRAGTEPEDEMNSTGKQRVRRASEKSGGTRLKPAQPGAWRPDRKSVGTGQARSLAGAKYQPPAWNNSAGAVKGGLAAQRTESLHTQTVLSPILKPLAKPSLPVEQSAAHGTAAIGGPSFSPARNSGVLNGSAIRHKP